MNVAEPCSACATVVAIWGMGVLIGLVIVLVVGVVAVVVWVTVVVVVLVVGVVVVLVVGVVVVLVVVVVFVVLVVVVFVVLVVVVFVVVVVVVCTGVVVVVVVVAVVGVVVVVVTGGGGTATIGGSEAAVVDSVVVLVVVVTGGGGGGVVTGLPVPVTPCRPPLLVGVLVVVVVVVPAGTSGFPLPWGPVGLLLLGRCPSTGLWPCSAAPATVPLPGSAALAFSETRADRFPPGMAGPLKTWPSVPRPVSGPLPVAAKSTAMIAAGMRMATSDAP